MSTADTLVARGLALSSLTAQLEARRLRELEGKATGNGNDVEVLTIAEFRERLLAPPCANGDHRFHILNPHVRAVTRTYVK